MSLTLFQWTILGQEIHLRKKSSHYFFQYWKSDENWAEIHRVLFSSFLFEKSFGTGLIKDWDCSLGESHPWFWFRLPSSREVKLLQNFVFHFPPFHYGPETKTVVFCVLVFLYKFQKYRHCLWKLDSVTLLHISFPW